MLVIMVGMIAMEVVMAVMMTGVGQLHFGARLGGNGREDRAQLAQQEPAAEYGDQGIAHHFQTVGRLRHRNRRAAQDEKGGADQEDRNDALEQR